MSTRAEKPKKCFKKISVVVTVEEDVRIFGTQIRSAGCMTNAESLKHPWTWCDVGWAFPAYMASSKVEVREQHFPCIFGLV